MKNCLVCGKLKEYSEFGSYCSKECRDSDVALLGKTCICERCNNEFKAYDKESLCIKLSQITYNSSRFKYY